MSKKEKRIVTEPVVIDLEGYRFEITDENITRYGRRGRETSKGELVKTHFDDVYNSLFCAHLLKDCKVKEGIASYYMGEKEKAEYEKAPTLAQCVKGLEEFLSNLTDHQYDAYYEDCRARHDGDEDYNRTEHDFSDLPYEMRMQDIFWHMLDLKEGRWHGSDNIRYQDTTGIPKIETTGERIYNKLLDLIWHMDNGPDYMSEEERRNLEALKRSNEIMADIFSDKLDDLDW